MDRRLARRALSPAMLLRCAMFLPVSFALAGAATQPDFANGDSCAQRIRLIDDQADQDVREVNREIARLRLELVAPPTSTTNASSKAMIQTELAAAQVRKKDTLRDHHSDLNDVRAQCDIQRAAARTRNASNSTIDH